MKQLVLKPQDIVVCMKLCLGGAFTTTNKLSESLYISVGEVHMALKRAEIARLLNVDGRYRGVIRTAFLEFTVHGLEYAFPATIGTVVRGVPTGIAAIKDIENYFAPTEALPHVWPHPEGSVTGIALAPLFPSVPNAIASDQKLYHALALIDAIRAGAAREREHAKQELRMVIAA